MNYFSSNYHYFNPCQFFASVSVDGLLLESEWQQVSSSLQDSSQYSADFNNAVACVFSILSLIFNSAILLYMSLGTVPKLPIIILISVIHVFHSFFSSLTKFKYFSIFSFSFIFTLWSAVFVFFCFFFFLIDTGSGLLTMIRWSISISKIQRILPLIF